MPTPVRRSLYLAVSVVLATTAIWYTAPAPTQAATTTLPNLRMHRIEGITIQVLSDGRRVLRFTSLMPNVGVGPLEVRGRRASTSAPMLVNQVVYNDSGAHYEYPTGATMQWSGDGHNHWHVVNGITYEIYPNQGPLTVRRGAKIGFCFVDSDPYALSLPNAPGSPVYTSGCGGQTALQVRAGVSVGWADKYPWNFAFQWIDITGLPGGTYNLRSTADQPNHYFETNNLDNCVYARIVLPASGTGPVEVLGRGSNCGPSSVTPVTSFPGGTAYNPPRRISFEAGTYVGYRFNSVGTTLRTRSMTLAAPSGANTSYRAIPVGWPSNWFYVVDGGLAGYWVKDRPEINLD
jgi:hypothetical protein